MALSFTEIAKGIEDAVTRSKSQAKAVEDAKKALADAQAAYAATVQSIQTLHGQYQAIIHDVLSLGGTVHVAK